MSHLCDPTELQALDVETEEDPSAYLDTVPDFLDEAPTAVRQHIVFLSTNLITYILTFPFPSIQEPKESQKAAVTNT
jgi:hypothetical protein